MNIDTLKAGAMLDMIVAKNVMKWTDEEVRERIGAKDRYAAWSPSTDMGVGMEVIELLKKRFLSASVGRVDKDQHGNGGLWHCTVGWEGKIQAAATTPAMAVCRAALKSVDGPIQLPDHFKSLNLVFPLLSDVAQDRILEVLQEYAIRERDLTPEEVEHLQGVISKIAIEMGGKK